MSSQPVTRTLRYLSCSTDHWRPSPPQAIMTVPMSVPMSVPVSVPAGSLWGGGYAWYTPYIHPLAFDGIYCSLLRECHVHVHVSFNGMSPMLRKLEELEELEEWDEPSTAFITVGTPLKEDQRFKVRTWDPRGSWVPGYSQSRVLKRTQRSK